MLLLLNIALFEDVKVKIMPCTQEQIECTKLIDNTLDTLSRIPRGERNVLHYLPRNALIYSWLLQSLNPVIDLKVLRNLLGQSHKEATELYISQLVYGGYAVFGSTTVLQRSSERLHQSMILCNQMKDAIEAHLANPANDGYGNMRNARWLLDGTSATELLRRLLEPGNTDLVVMIGNAIRKALDNRVLVKELSNIPELSDTHFLDRDLARYTRIITLPSNKSFALLVYPSNTALSTQQTEHIALFLSNLRMTLHQRAPNTYNAIHSLFITPAIDATEDIYMFGYDVHIHYMWAFSVMRLIIELESLYYDYSDQIDRLAKEFTSIFDPQESTSFSIREAVANLRRKLPKPRLSQGCVTFCKHDHKNYVLLQDNNKNKPMQIPLRQEIDAKLRHSNIQHVGEIHESCPDMLMSMYWIYDFQSDANPSQIAYPNSKLRWELAGEAQLNLTECEQKAITDSLTLWLA